MKISNRRCGKPLRVYNLQPSSLQPIFKLDRKGQGFISLALNW
jgi:hypothetical protein